MTRPRSPADWSQELLSLQSAIVEAPAGLADAARLVAAGALRTLPSAIGARVELRDELARGHRAESGLPVEFGGPRRPDAALIRRSIETGDALLFPGPGSEALVDAAGCAAAGIGSVLVAPILHDGAATGTLSLYATAPDAFDAQDLIVARLVAGLLPAAIAREARHHTRSERDEMARRFRATFEQAAVGIAHVAPDGNFLRVNDRFCAIVGHSREELIHGGFQQITHRDDLRSDLENVGRLVRGEIASYVMEKRYIRADQQLVWVNLTVSLVRNARGRPDFFVAVIEDITRRKTAEERALHDPLTGLPNRRWLTEHFDTLFGGTPGKSVVVYLDLDGFKAVNDRFGHAEGDRCLLDVAACLEQVLRERDSVCRIAGDEFVILLPDTDGETALRLIGDFREALRALSCERPWKIGVSAGAVSLEAQQFASLEEILEAADRLMYRAKKGPGIEPVIGNIRDVLVA